MGRPPMIASGDLDAPRATDGLVRPSRTRCLHCSMPIRHSRAACWSCGLDPATPTRPAEPGALHAPGAGQAGRPPRPALLVGAGLLIALVVLVSTTALAAPAGRDRGIRGLTARIRGETWPRATVLDASARFPAPPVHWTLPAGPGRPPSESLVATGSGLRTELMVADIAGAPTQPGMRAVAERLVTGYATSAGGRVVQQRPVTVRGAPGVDAVLDVAGTLIRVRAAATATTGYVMAVTGSSQAFDRFTGSFERAG